MILCSIDLFEFLTPIFICVVLPVSIVWMVMNASKFREAKRTEVLIKAIESGKDIDANMIANAMSKPTKHQKTPRERQNTRLTLGSIFTLMGVLLFAFVYHTMWDDIKIVFVFGSFAAILFSIGIGNLITFFVAHKQVKD